MPLLIETVVALNEALTTLSSLEESLSGIPEEMQELHDQYSVGKAESERLEGVIEEAGAERRATEAESQDCGVKLEHYREQVSRVKTQREYAAILQEIDLVKARTRELEDLALAAMERQEEAEKELVELRTSFDETEQQYQAELEKWEAAKPGVAAEAEELRDQIAGLEGDVPMPGLMLFERIRTFTNGHALAGIHEATRAPRGPRMWHCDACNYDVRPQIVVDIKNNGSLVQCDSCKRILFINESVA